MTDKTGTLTDNVMALRMLALRGRTYGRVDDSDGAPDGAPLSRDPALLAELRAAAARPPPRAGPFAGGAEAEGGGGRSPEAEGQRQLLQVPARRRAAVAAA